MSENEAPKRKLSKKGESLYALLGLEKGCSDEDIKRAYRQLALKYHPDKNPNNPQATAQFQEINKAKSVLQDPTKKEIYDKYGSVGLSIAEQVGEDKVKYYFLASTCWFKALLITVFALTGCCCCCCCCMCCGKCAKEREEGEEEEEENNNETEEQETNVDMGGYFNQGMDDDTRAAAGPIPMPMPMPPPRPSGGGSGSAIPLAMPMPASQPSGEGPGPAIPLAMPPPPPSDTTNKPVYTISNGSGSARDPSVIVIQPSSVYEYIDPDIRVTAANDDSQHQRY